MCGIAGLINRGGMPVAEKLIDMLALIQHRGPDASGIAVYGGMNETEIRVAMTTAEMLEPLKKMISGQSEIVTEKTYGGGGDALFFEATLNIDENNIAALHRTINSTRGLYVHSLGTGFRVYKDGGTTERLTGHHAIKMEKGATHGIGHVRMATESAEDINAAHPFVSPFYPELAIVHNGQFTNYFNVRRSLESKGAIFRTLNDSEAASHFIANAMKENGGDLEAALNQALEDLDGIFCIIAATPTQVGFVKDRLGIKPLLLFEKDDMTMFGSEQIEFTTLFPGRICRGNGARGG